MVELQQTRRRNCTELQRLQFEQVPDTLASFQSDIKTIINDLGSEYFRNLPGASGKALSDFNIKIVVIEFLLVGQVSIILRYNSSPQTKALIKLKISKAKLYEAKVGVVEMQKQWDWKGSGN
jgi:hypothetical protein